MNNCEFKLEEGVLTLKNEKFTWSISDVASAKGELAYEKSRALPPFRVDAVKGDGKAVSYEMWEDISALRLSCAENEPLFEVCGEHWSVRAVKLNAYTDACDTLVDTTLYELFYKGVHKTVAGDIFIFENILSDKAYVVISETPDHIRGEMRLRREKPADPFVIKLSNGGYPVVVGECKKGECEEFCRDYFRHANCCPELVTMSNTWGDCNAADRVCHAFIEKEIEAAKEIGVDIVQIDDGWQAGNTLYVCKRDERGNRIFDEPFWDLNTERFPEGIMPLSEKATKYGIKVGMWFAPSSHDCFAKIERDKAALRRCYEEYGARFFKLDMYQASDKAHVEKMLELLREIYSFGDDVSVQMDVTRYERLNYLCGREYGTIFVENRYTKNGWSYPYKPLKNLWDISKYMPSNRFQFELVNPDLNTECYPEDDVLAPKYYTMDYLFASVMLSNPLFWMEIQFLSEERRAELAPLLKVWKEHRGSFASADVKPIGDRPNGCSHTGFLVSSKGEPEYLLLFREYTDTASASYEIPLEGAYIPEILATNGALKVDIKDGVVTASFKDPRTYALIKLEKADMRGVINKVIGLKEKK